MTELYKSKWILPANKKIIEDGALIVDNGIITDVLTLPLNFNCNNYKVIECGNSVITPGFINLHAHLQYTDMTKDNKPRNFTEWITTLIKKYGGWSEQEKLQSFEKGLKQILKSGTTCVAQLSKEVSFFNILNSSPLKTYLFLETFADSEENAGKAFEDFKQKYNTFSEKCSDSTFIGISPHSVYTVHPHLWRLINEFSRQNNILVHTHLAESKEEMEWLEFGKSDLDSISEITRTQKIKLPKKFNNPVEYLAQFQILNENLIVAHANQLNEKSLMQLACSKTNLVHCPRSNIILHGNTINPSKNLEIFKDRIGIGTDSLFSNYDLNILNEAQNINLELLTVLDMLTINAAKILRLDKTIGSLEKGKDADFLVFKLKENQDYKALFSEKYADRIFIKGKMI